MKLTLLRAGLAAMCLFFVGPSVAADSAGAKADLQALVEKIKAKLQAGSATEASLSAELAEFDQLLTKYQGTKTDDVAFILVMKATLYLQVLEDDDKAIALLEKLKRDFPDTAPASKVDEMLAGIRQQQAANAVKRSLKVGAKFPEFSEPDIAGRKITLADYKGKVVLIDFWATWCGPCIAELPNLVAAYEKHHPGGFEIIGISLDREDAGEKLKAFTKERKMPWVQIFDGKGWQAKLAQQYGVNSIPATYLLDTEGKIAAKDLRGEALEKEVARLLAKK